MNEILNDFPMLKKGYIYFNNASTTFKPKVVIDKITEYYENYGVNTNRGIDSLGYEVTQKYENVRNVVACHIGATSKEIVFTRGTTDGINMIARMLEEKIESGDEIIVSIHEHHANFIPWQELALRKNGKLVIASSNEDGTVNIKDLKDKINNRTKIVAFNHTSNVFGGTNNLKEIADIVHKYNAYFIVDGAQGIVHHKVNLKDSGVDFYVFSAHKLYGPMGVGVLYGKYEILNTLKPVVYGGEMIEFVSLDKTTYKEAPYSFEAGTMMVPEVLGLGEAINYINKIGIDKINNHIKNLRKYLIEKLTDEIKDINIYNKSIVDSSLITFNINNLHSHDVASFLDKEKIIVRAGHHCAQPLADYLSLTSTVRISLAIYNTKEECDILVEKLKKVGEYINVLF